MKAQSAIEYLTVYGWALVALLVVLSALYMSGILKLQTVAPRECVFIPGFECVDFKLTGGPADTLDLKLVNNLGFKIKIMDMNVSSKTGGSAGSGSVFFVPAYVNPPQIVDNGETENIRVDLATAVAVGSYHKFSVNISYINCETTPTPGTCAGLGSTHFISGRVYAPAE